MVAWKWNQKSFLNGCHELRVIFCRFSSITFRKDLRQDFSKGLGGVCVCVFFCMCLKPHVPRIEFQGIKTQDSS